MPPHFYLIVSTNFELEPLLEDYAQRYPGINIADFGISFKGTNEHPTTPYSYNVIYTRPSTYQHGTTFVEFMAAYCKVNRTKAVTVAEDYGFPDLAAKGGMQTGRVYE